LLNRFTAGYDVGMSTATITAPSQMTAEEFLKLHGDESGVELVKGRIVRSPMPGLDHGRVCFKAALLFGRFADDRDLGRMMTCDSFIPTGNESVRGADFCFFSYKRLPKDTPTPKKTADVPPELVVEVRSPSDRIGAIREKVKEYLAAGVDVVVLLDPAVETATVFKQDSEVQLTNADELTLPDILPEFRVPVSQFFS
jgi:Uma2 family endonuclease